MSLAGAKTSRCFITAGSEIENGAAISLPAGSRALDRRSTMARRVGERREGKMQRLVVIVNHMVKYWGHEPACQGHPAVLQWRWRRHGRWS
jgi:hypothetical protein